MSQTPSTEDRLATLEAEVARILDRITRFPATSFYVSIVSFHEQIVGWNACLNRARAITGAVSAYQMFQDEGEGVQSWC